MVYLLLGGAGLVAVWFFLRWYAKADVRKVVKGTRWLVGGGAAVLAAFLALRGQLLLASFLAPVAVSVLRFGRRGPLDCNTTESIGSAEESAVRSRFIAMHLDHDTGTVSGRVLAGRFRSRDLFSLDEEEMAMLLEEVAGDGESVSLLEAWLDKNRDGWRGAQAPGGEAAHPSASSSDPVREAYDVLGLQPGGTREEITAAHHALMKKMHPDQGGSTYLASKINQAKDLLLRTARR